jgi:hypothetical protein
MHGAVHRQVAIGAEALHFGFRRLGAEPNVAGAFLHVPGHGAQLVGGLRQRNLLPDIGHVGQPPPRLDTADVGASPDLGQQRLPTRLRAALVFGRQLRALGVAFPVAQPCSQSRAYL